MNAKEQDRRRFLKEGAALAGLAVGAVGSARGQTPGAEQPTIHRSPSYGQPSRFVTTVRTGDVAAGSAPLQDLVGIITPNSLHYYINHRAATPDIDPRQHRLLIHGMVDRPLMFTLEDLKRLPSVTRVHFLSCAGNTGRTLKQRRDAKTVQQTHGSTSCAEWTGVPLSVLLKEAGVQKGAAWLIAEGSEAKKHSMSSPLSKAMDDALIAYGQNGEPVRPENGFPFRLLLPGFEGTRNVKWLRRIKVVDQPYMSMFETSMYSDLYPDGKARWFQFELEPNSVITFPSGEQRLPSHGFYEISGLAWSGGGAVRGVDVSTDGGRTWKEAELQEPIHRKAHARFHFPWTWNGEEAVLQSRCTDEKGNTQPSLSQFSEIWHVSMDFWLTTKRVVQHWNAIQPWKVARDGSVHNAQWDFLDISKYR